MRTVGLFLLLALAACGARSRTTPADPEVATFSICARDPATGDLGVAVQSKVFGVGVVVPWVRADVGAVATQALANPRYGPEGIEMLDDGLAADDVVALLTDADPGRERRQLGVVDGRGRAAAFTGARTFAWAGHRVGEGYCCQGNILAGPKVVIAMAEAFEKSKADPLPERLVAALRAGQKAGGDKRGRQSAALLVARRHGGYLGANDRYIDIRVDDHEKPIEELARLLKKRRGFGREARVPRTVEGLVRETRRWDPAAPSVRALWERWRRLRIEKDYDAILALYDSDYRAKHDVAALRKTDEQEGERRARAERGAYLGTKIEGPRAALYFDHPKEGEPIVVRFVKESGRWRIVPLRID